MDCLCHLIFMSRSSYIARLCSLLRIYVARAYYTATANLAKWRDDCLSFSFAAEEITCYWRPDLFVHLVIINDSIATMAFLQK